MFQRMIAHRVHIYRAVAGRTVLGSFKVRDQAVLTETVTTTKTVHSVKWPVGSI